MTLLVAEPVLHADHGRVGERGRAAATAARVCRDFVATMPSWHAGRSRGVGPGVDGRDELGRAR